MLYYRKIGQNNVPKYSSPIVNCAEEEVGNGRWD